MRKKNIPFSRRLNELEYVKSISLYDLKSKYKMLIKNCKLYNILIPNKSLMNSLSFIINLSYLLPKVSIPDISISNGVVRFIWANKEKDIIIVLFSTSGEYKASVCANNSYKLVSSQKAMITNIPSLHTIASWYYRLFI